MLTYFIRIPDTDTGAVNGGEEGPSGYVISCADVFVHHTGDDPTS